MPTSGADEPTSCFEIAIAGGAIIRTPANIRLMTPYILLEQEDWFEEETDFLRKVIEPGMTAIDIGANYGVYAATLAASVGSQGKVLAIEPASTTARYLRTTLSEFSTTTLLQAALGEVDSEATLVVADNSESNRLVSVAAADEQVETVPLRRLDDVVLDITFPTPDFIKLDAEGAETNILAGAKNLLAKADPLIMFERKHGASVNTDLIEAFESLGFGIYQLLPGPAVLAPYDAKRTDAFGLNLFAVKPTRANQLAATGRLITAWPSSSDPGDETSLAVALLLDRANAFATAAQAAGEEGVALSPLLAFARISRDLGLRQPAIDALGRALNLLQAGKGVIDPTTLSPDADFDTTPENQRDLTWATAATITAYERARNYSSYFTDQATLPLLDRLRDTPFAIPEMLRRRQLMQVRAGQRRQLEWEVGFGSFEVKNQSFWRGDVDLGL